LVKLFEDDIKTKEVLSWQGLHLLHFNASSCSQKTRIVLNLKGIAWQSHPINLLMAENYDAWYLGINPRGLVPTLVHDGNVFIESNDIITYLDETYTEPKLLTKALRPAIQEQLELEDSLHMDLRTLTMRFVLPDFLARKPSKALKQSEDFDGTIGGIADNHSKKNTDFWRLQAEQGITERQAVESILKFQDAFNTLEDRLKESSYILGNRLTLADIGWFVYAQRLKATGYPLKRLHPNVSSWHTRLAMTKEFASEIREPIPLKVIRNLYKVTLMARRTTLADLSGI